MPEVSLVMTLRDRVSNTMKSIMNSGKALSKEWDELYERVSTAESQQAALEKELAKTRTSLTQQTDAVKKAKTEWNDLRKSEDASADAIAEKAAAFQEATEKLENLKNKLNQYTEASRDSRAEIKELTSEYRNLRKATSDLDDGNAGSEASLGSGSGLLEKLSKAGITKLAGDAASQFLNYALESFAGQPTASALSSTLSGAVTGYALGGWLGAGAGAAAGAATGITQILTAKDDAFKSYYQEAIQTVMDEQANAITSGSSIAGSREQTLMAFSQRFGSDAAAAAYLDQVKTMAGRTNYSYDEITGYSKLLLNSYSANETFGVLQSLSDATAGLGLGTGDVSTMISSLSRMRTTGKATQEYLNAFSERGVDVYSALAGFAGGDRSKVAEMISGGKIGGVEAAQAILDYIDQQFGGLSDKLATTYDAMVANLEDAEANMEAMAGEGYNEKRKEGLAAQQEWLTGNRAMEDAYKAIGAWEAELENSKEQYIRDAVDAIMGTDEYIQAMSDGDAVTMGRLIMEAKVKGMNEYNASDGAQLALESELALAGKIREDTASNQAYWDAGYRKSQEYSKGLAAGLITEENVKTVLGAVGETTSSVTAGLYGTGVDYGGSGYAFGLGRVPYDGFPAILHEGERVLTAGEARAQDRAGGAPISIQINGLSVREEADVDRVAAALYDKLQTARMAG